MNQPAKIFRLLLRIGGSKGAGNNETSLATRGDRGIETPSRPPEAGGRRPPGFRGAKAKGASVKLSPHAPRPFATRVVVRLPGRNEQSQIQRVWQNHLAVPLCRGGRFPLGGTEGGKEPRFDSPPNAQFTRHFSSGAKKRTWPRPGAKTFSSRPPLAQTHRIFEA
jgi:hypothetical protein